MKLWLQLPIEMDPEHPKNKSFFNLVNKAYKLIKRPDTNITIKSVQNGLKDLEQISYTSLRFLNEREVLATILQAEKEGFDGILNLGYLDPALKAIKQISSIPVVGCMETAMHFASLVGHKFAIITSKPEFIPIIQELLNLYQMDHFSITYKPVRSLSVSFHELINSLDKRDFNPLITDFKTVALGCIDDEAEVLIVGCGLICPLLLEAGLKDLEGVPIVNPQLIGLKVAEVMVDLHQAGIPVISRKGLFHQATPQYMEETMNIFR